MESEFAGASFNEVGVISCDNNNQHGVSCLAFDPEEELLWASTFEVVLKLFCPTLMT